MAKVHELAKELGISSKELIARLTALGIEVKSHMSTLTDEEVYRVKNEGTSPASKSDEDAKPKVIAGAPPFAGAVAGAPPFAGAVAGAPPFAGAVVAASKAIVDEEYFEKKKKKVEETIEPEIEEVTSEVAIEETKEELTEDYKEEPEKDTESKSDLANDVETVSEEQSETEPELPEAEPKEEPKKEDAELIGEPEEKPVGEASDKKEEPSEKEPLPAVEPDIKVETKKLKIVKKASEISEEENRKPKQKQEKRFDKQERNARREDLRRGEEDREERRNQKQGKNRFIERAKPEEEQPALPKAQDRRRRGPSADASREDGPSKGQGKRASKGKQFDNKRDKYDKLERKSLEKQTKGKHAKYKVAEVVPEVEEEILPEGTVVLTVPITVAGFCEQTEVSTSKVIMTLMKLGIMANINQNIDEETVMVLAEELGISVHIGRVEEEIEEEGLELFEDKDSDLVPRSPIITVMGHVDHGKTSLLDAIRKTNVTASESGGITQHIGASEVSINGQKIVFLDTPGHEAFTAMRARGAHVTDIAVLVVAADDGVMPQTIESISHAKAAGVPIIVAINKMDKPGANPDRVKQELSEHGVLVEEWGGDVISVPVSAKSGDGIVNLLEMILLQAEVLELKANPNRLAMGSVIEARLDKAKGPVATLLVTNGTLESGQSIVAGTCAGRIRLMTDDKGRTIKKAGPATAVEILGLTEVPQAGDEFNAVKEDRIAREIAERRSDKLREEVLARNASMSLEKLFSQIQEGQVKELNLIIKGDVQGSIGALVSSLEKLNNEQVKVNIIHTGVGTVTESDVMLAETSGAVIIGFNIRPSTAVQSMADRNDIEIRTYRVIYDVIDDVEAAMKGMLDPEFKEEILGKVEIRNTFKVPNVGIIGGAYVTEGKVVRNAQVRLVRDGIVIHEGTISSLKRFKDDAKEVNQGYECGIGIENYNDIKEGDVIECFHMVEIKRD